MCPVAWLVVSFGVILGQRPLNPHNYVALHGRLLRQTNSRLWSHDNGAGNQHKAMDMISSCAPFDGPSVPLIWLLKILAIMWPVSCTRSSGALSSQWVLDLLRLFWGSNGVSQCTSTEDWIFHADATWCNNPRTDNETHPCICNPWANVWQSSNFNEISMHPEPIMKIH